MKLLKVHESKWVFSNFLHQRRGKQGHGDIDEGQYGELILSELSFVGFVLTTVETHIQQVQEDLEMRSYLS